MQQTGDPEASMQLVDNKICGDSGLVRTTAVNCKAICIRNFPAQRQVSVVVTSTRAHAEAMQRHRNAKELGVTCSEYLKTSEGETPTPSASRALSWNVRYTLYICVCLYVYALNFVLEYRSLHCRYIHVDIVSCCR